MTETFNIPISRVKYKGIYSWTGLYDLMHKWFTAREFEFHEKLYKDKTSPELSETEVKWWAIRKVSGYIMYRIEIFFHLWNLKEIEVVKEGKEPVIKPRAYVEPDKCWGCLSCATVCPSKAIVARCVRPTSWVPEKPAWGRLKRREGVLRAGDKG